MRWYPILINILVYECTKNDILVSESVVFESVVTGLKKCVYSGFSTVWIWGLSFLEKDKFSVWQCIVAIVWLWVISTGENTFRFIFIWGINVRIFWRSVVFAIYEQIRKSWTKKPDKEDLDKGQCARDPSSTFFRFVCPKTLKASENTTPLYSDLKYKKRRIVFLSNLWQKCYTRFNMNLWTPTETISTVPKEFTKGIKKASYKSLSLVCMNVQDEIWCRWANM